jgi:hypothetical protein
MRILHIDSGREMRGGQFQALALIRGLAARGCEQKLLARSGSPLLECAAAEGIEVAPLSLAAVRSCSRTVDLTHAHDAHAHTLAAVLACGPLVVSRRVAFPVRTGPLSRWKYARADRFLAVSQFVRAELLKAGVDPNRIAVVYDGASVPQRQSAGNRILAPATDDPAKGSSLLREAAKLAGVAVEFSSNLAADLPGAGLFVYLTRSEGLGSAILFAMAHGVPVIASEVGGIPEIVQNGYTGMLVHNEARQVAAAIRRLLADPEHSAQMAAEARRRMLDRYTLDHMVESTLAVYRSLEAGSEN